MLGFRDYIDFAEFFAREAEKSENDYSSNRLLVPATILAWSAIEAFVNNILDDFSSVPSDMFTLHERAFLLEKRLKFQDSGNDMGKFMLGGSEHKRLDHKIIFLLGKFKARGRKGVKGGTLWQRFLTFKDMRDALVHPRRRDDFLMTIEQVNKFIDTAKSVIQLVSSNVWGRKVEF